MYDGIIADHAVLGSFCELQEPVILSSFTSVLFVRLLMNISMGDAEFYFSYNMYCGAVFKEIQYLELESTHFDVSKMYDDNINCTWKIIVHEFERLILDITDIDMQLGTDCENGFLKVTFLKSRYNSLLNSLRFESVLSL